MKVTKLFSEFFESEKAGGVVLIICTVVSLILANSSLQTNYLALWHTTIGGLSAEHWINDGLMAIFFLLIGLELEREVYIGELSSIKNASLPVFSALGGMLVPAAFYLIFNFGKNHRIGLWYSHGHRYCFCHWYSITPRQKGFTNSKDFFNRAGRDRRPGRYPDHCCLLYKLHIIYLFDDSAGHFCGAADIEPA
jgi:hypothetical protein